MNLEILNEEFAKGLALDYGVKVSTVYELHKSLIQTIFSLDEAFVSCLDEEFIGRLLESSVAIKSSMKPKKMGGTGYGFSNERIIAQVLYQTGITSSRDTGLKKLRS